MNRQELVAHIIALEWEMFSAVNNVGGKADCQSDDTTFRIMRESQCSLMGEELLQSLLNDLICARDAGRNLMMEKYARMMASTHPADFAHIADRLPPLDPLAEQLVDEIVTVNIAWKEELDRKHPRLAGRGRPLRSRDDKEGGTASLETYLRAELSTYSVNTLALWHVQTMRRRQKGENEAELNLLYQVQRNGFPDLDAAERHFAN